MLSTKHHQHPLFDNFPGQHIFSGYVQFIYKYIFSVYLLFLVKNIQTKLQRILKTISSNRTKHKQLYIECMKITTIILTTFVGVNACYFNFSFLFFIFVVHIYSPIKINLFISSKKFVLCLLKCHKVIMKIEQTTLR